MTLNEILLCEAIRARCTVSLWYDGGQRECAPFAIGISTAGNINVRLWQISGFTTSKERLPGWRMFIVAKICNLTLLHQTFLEIPSGYNPKDKQLQVIWLSVPFHSA